MDRKWTFVMFAVGGLLLAYVLTQTGLWAWEYLASTDLVGDYVGKPNPLVISVLSVLLAVGGTALAFRNERLVELSGEVAAELRKVTWPTREETFAATIVVVVTVILSSLFLFVVDQMWSGAARLIYG